MIGFSSFIHESEDLGGQIHDKHGQTYDVRHSRGVNNEHVFTVHHGDDEVGRARLSHTGEHVVDLGVRERYRRRGVASALYDHIESRVGKLKPSPVYQTQAGHDFWKSRRREE